MLPRYIQSLLGYSSIKAPNIIPIRTPSPYAHGHIEPAHLQCVQLVEEPLRVVFPPSRFVIHAWGGLAQGSVPNVGVGT